MDFKEKTKKWAVNGSVNTGVTVGEKFASLTGSNPKAFITVNEDTANIAGKKLNLQFSPGQIELMGGLFTFNKFPLCLIPTQPSVIINTAIINKVINIATSLVEMLVLF